ncbi:MAG: ATP-binding cassette domain-containing protein [Clostridia bacterium]|nr:ATP-binding cassette domain-containing protein [Clostridia bacterium]
MLEIKNVKIEYYGEDLCDLNFAFNKGVTLILGEVGSFKTTLFLVLGGVKYIEQGEVIIDGENIEEIPPKHRNMAYVGLNSTPRGCVLSELMRPLLLRKTDRKQARAIALDACNMFSLAPRQKIKKLSLEQLIRFFRARLSLRDSNVTMFDEPYHYFGEQNEQAITDMIRSRNGYVLVASCDGADVTRLEPDYLVIVRRDKVLYDGKAQDVTYCQDEYVKKLLSI